MSKNVLSQKSVELALEEMDKLAIAEYREPLQKLLTLPLAEQRLRRLAGVIVKMPFATSKGPESYNPTDSLRSWHWDAKRFNDPRLIGTKEYQLLEHIRVEQNYESLEKLQAISQEAGLMWVLGKYLKGRLEGEEKTFSDYYYEPKSPEVDLALNVANLLPAASVLAGVVGVPVLAVNLALIVTKFGYEKLTEPPMQPDS